jgi:Na+-driven multidrug efflux pump
MSIVGIGMLLTALNAALSICVRNTGDTRSPVYIAFGMNILHIILNSLFIFGAWGFPKWGLFGVAVSTVIVWFMAILVLLRLFRHAFGSRLAWVEFIRFDLKLLKEILRIGWPLSVNGGSWTISQLAIFSFIGVMGDQELATGTYMNTMESFALMLLLREYILTYFTHDRWIIDMAGTLLWLNLILQPGKMLNMALGQSINAIGDTRFPMYVSLPSMWIIAVGLTYVLGLSMEWRLYGVYAGMILDEYTRGVIMWFRWRRHRKTGKFANAFHRPSEHSATRSKLPNK